jgi:integrase
VIVQVKGGFSEMIRAGSVVDAEGKHGRGDQFRLKLDIPESYGSPVERLELAKKRVAVLRRMRDDLVAAGRGPEAKLLMIEAGKVAADDVLFDTAVNMAEVVASLPKERSLRWRTWGELADAWTSGELARLYPRAGYGKETHDDDIPKVDLFRPVLGDVELCAFNDQNYWAAMRLLPDGRSDATFRHHAQVIRRVLKLAVELGLIEKWPLGPNCKLPKIDKKKAPVYTFVYPDEDALLMGCEEVAFEYRVLWGFIMREGLRIGEAFRIRWEHIDRSFPRGILRVPETKTGRALEFVFEWGTLEALDELRARMPKEPGPFSWLTESALDKVAERVRAHLVKAGCDRQTLLFSSGRQKRLREHDLRATFVTLAKLQGKDDAYVSAKTGHESSKMIQRYNHAKATLEQLGLPSLARLDEALGLGRRQPGPERGGAGDSHSAAVLAGAPAVSAGLGEVTGSAVERAEAGRPERLPGCDAGCDGRMAKSAAESGDSEKSSMFSAVRETGVEPASPEGRRNLNPAFRDGRDQKPGGFMESAARETTGTDRPSQQGVTPAEAYARALKAASHLAIDANAPIEDVGHLRRMYDIATRAVEAAGGAQVVELASRRREPRG